MTEKLKDKLGKFATEYSQDKYLPVQTHHAVVAGAGWYRDNVWFNTDEIPESAGYVVVLSYRLVLTEVIFTEKPSEKEWNVFVHSHPNGIVKWAYRNNLLPYDILEQTQKRFIKLNKEEI